MNARHEGLAVLPGAAALSMRASLAFQVHAIGRFLDRHG
jgi:hypothetical protein